MFEPTLHCRIALLFVFLAAANSCLQPHRPSDSTVKSPAPATTDAMPIPDTPAGHQLAAWLEVFNSGDRRALLAYHEQHFPYEVANHDVASHWREHGLSRATGGFEPRRIEWSESDRLVMLLQSRHHSDYARVALKVSPKPPHPVTRFRINSIATPLELLSPDERAARELDAEERYAALESIGHQLETHYIFADVATRVAAVLKKKLARGDYDQLSDAAEFADALSRDLRRLSRDKHLRLRFGPMPPKPQLDRPTPPRNARMGDGIAPVERLEGNVAHLTLHGFPPLLEAGRQAIIACMSEIADADALIVDLRENRGGFPPTEKLIASYFFDPEPVHLRTMYRRDTNETWKVWTESDLPGRRFGSKRPVYVLTGPDTFSGGEALAYDLQAQGRAIVVGEGTGGGAHASWPYPVAGGFVLRVPFSRSENPVTGTDWESIGVVPDVEVPADEALETAHRLALEKLFPAGRARTRDARQSEPASPSARP